MALVTTTDLATFAAVMAAGMDTRTDVDMVGVDPFVWPPPAYGQLPDAYKLQGTKAVDLIVAFHGNLAARTVMLVIDRDLAPLTGDYVFVADGTPSTYDATAAAPADIDELLLGWAAKIIADFPLFTATPLPSQAPSPDDNALRIVGNTTTGTYSTFAIEPGTAAPELAALELVREIDSASLKVYSIAGSRFNKSSTMSPLVLAQSEGWRIVGDIGILQFDGYEQRSDMASRSAVWLHLHSPVHTDTVSVVVSGPGIYTITNAVLVAAAPQVVP